jgi:hypothetical protein
MCRIGVPGKVAMWNAKTEAAPIGLRYSKFLFSIADAAG